MRKNRSIRIQSYALQYLKWYLRFICRVNGNDNRNSAGIVRTKPRDCHVYSFCNLLVETGASAVQLSSRSCRIKHHNPLSPNKSSRQRFSLDVEPCPVAMSALHGNQIGHSSRQGSSSLADRQWALISELRAWVRPLGSGKLY